MIVLGAVLAAAAFVLVMSSGSEKSRCQAVFVGAGVFTALRWDNRLQGWPDVILLLVILAAVRPKRHGRSPGLDIFQKVALLLAVIALVSMFWSPVKIEAFATVGNWVALVLAIAIARAALQSRAETLALCYGVMVPMVTLAATVILFNLVPSLEQQYYQSRISTLFLGNTGNVLYQATSLTTNSAVELGRAAGFLFVNVNRASMAMGVSATLAMAVGMRYDSRGLRRIALVLAVGIVMTGSKTGLVLLVVAVVVYAVAKSTARLGGRAMTPFVIVCAAASAIVVTRDLVAANGEFVQESRVTLLPRVELWGEVWRAIGENPFLGLGFGGWLQRWQGGDVSVAFTAGIRPAHNWFFQAWLDGGVAYMAAAVLFAALMIRAAVTAYRRVAGGAPGWMLLLTFPGAWIILHGLGDNSALYGDTSTVIPLALAIALIGGRATSVSETPKRALSSGR